MARNLKIRPNFLNHVAIQNTADVEKLYLELMFSTQVISGIGETFRSLKLFHIIGPSIKFLERETFAAMEQLELLRLGFIGFEFLPEDVFQDLPNLQVLDLAGNRIKNFPAEVFKNLRKLKKVDFRYNKIEHLPKDLFADNLELDEIRACNNPFKTIDVNFTELPKLKQLDLSNAGCINFLANDKAKVQEAQRIINRNCTSTIS